MKKLILIIAIQFSIISIHSQDDSINKLDSTLTETVKNVKESETWKGLKSDISKIDNYFSEKSDTYNGIKEDLKKDE